MREHSPPALKARTRRVARNLGLDSVVEATSDDYYSHYSTVRPSILKECAPHKTKRFFETFYGHDKNERKDFFPNGTEIGNYMERLLRVPWFNPKKEYVKSELDSYVYEISCAFDMCFNGHMITSEGYYCGRKIVFDFTKMSRLIAAVANAAGFSALCNDAKDIAYYHAQNCRSKGVPAGIAAIPAVQNAVAGAAYIVMDLPPQDNPFERLLTVYELGLGPVGINSSGQLVIWHPEVEKDIKRARQQKK